MLERKIKKMTTLITLKIGRNSYDVTAETRFMDNGHCVQLLVKNKTMDKWGRGASPKLSKRAIKEISCFVRVEQEHDHDKRVSVFTLGNVAD